MDALEKPLKAQFERELHQALQDLYDPPRLGRSVLITLLGVEQREDPTAALREALMQAIDALRPEADVPPQANAWRLYHILRQRYVEQFPQRDIAANLALSTRQLRRHQLRALRALADYLWARHHLAQRAPALLDLADQKEAATSITGPTTPSPEEEMAWLKETCPSEMAAVAELIQAALATVAPLLRSLAVGVASTLNVSLPPVAVQVTALRAALLNILTTAVRSVPGGCIHISAEVSPPQVVISIQPTAQHPGCVLSPDADGEEKLAMARHLVALAGGTLDLVRDAKPCQPFTARLLLPSPEEITVLVVDDNADTLRLLERYLEGTRYRFLGVRDPLQVVALAEEASPHIIVLDLMLPRVDGWSLLGRLREHPRTRHIPVILCSILPQEDLGLALGASALIRKPVNRAAFLAALDRQVEIQRESH